MAKGVNKVILIGTLGRDPETRHTASGSAVTNMSLATNESWKDKNTGEKQERTEWHNVTLFGRLAEVAEQYLRKGSQAYIEGSLRTEKWQDKTTGEDKYRTVIVASELQLIGGRGDRDDTPQDYGKGGKPDHAKAASRDDFDDDVPF